MKKNLFKKLISIVLVMVMLVTCMGAYGGEIAYASEVVQASKISLVEQNFYNNSFAQFLYDTGAKDFNYAEIKSYLIYNGDDEAVYVLTNLDGNGYMISDRKTGVSLERTPKGDNPYSGIENENAFYLGVDNYYKAVNNQMIHTFDDSLKITKEQGRLMQADMDEVTSWILQENGRLSEAAMRKEANSAPVMASSTLPEQYRENNSEFASYTAKNYFNQEWSANAFVDIGDGKMDILLPDNDGDSCAIVASIQLLQYLDRNNIVDTSTSFINVRGNDINYDPYTDLGDFYLNCLSQKMHDELDSMVWHGIWGENYSIHLAGSLNDFAELYQPLNRYGNDVNMTFGHNLGYDNMMGQIDDGELAVAMTGLSGVSGYYQENEDWTSVSVARHQMLVYGYCKIDFNFLQDFICHSGWRVDGREMLYVNKMSFIANVTYDVV